ncbi:helix-turn-helix domain-containing protein [Paenibacillus sp. MBLB4367]|uniref:helix-turn-helix domain-containing protein n=1 Tax=Paenibacillus sp. MBLB4367 TaxID=3384767 RepID=UPI003908252C
MFGRRLAELRNQRGMSQYELADRLQLSRGQIANYEQGTREPDFKTLILLADFFEVSLDFMLSRIDKPNSLRLDEETVVLSASEAGYLHAALAIFRKYKDK